MHFSSIASNLDRFDEGRCWHEFLSQLFCGTDVYFVDSFFRGTDVGMYSTDSFICVADAGMNSFHQKF